MTKKIFFPAPLLLTGILVGLYVFQLNSATTLAWHISQAEQQVAELKHVNTKLQAQAYRALPLRDLQALAQARNFEKITSVIYVRLPGGLVAQTQF